jgi:carboxymethylenebutenolidase
VGAAGYIKSLPISNGKVGVSGSCSGGRHTFLCACRTSGVFDAAVECWGGNVVQAEDRLTAAQPVSPLDYTKDLSCPLLGLFGNDDQNPTPAQVDTHEQELKAHGKNYEFHRYDGAGHGFFYYHLGMYRQEQAVDAWGKVWDFLGRNLS